MKLLLINGKTPESLRTLPISNSTITGDYELWEFRIRAGNNLGPGPFIGIELSRSGQDPPQSQPKDVKVGNIQARSVKLSWQPVTAPPTEVSMDIG